MDNRTIEEIRKNETLLIEEIKGLIEENQELKKQLEELEFIVGLRQKRNLIHKFDKEYDEEDKKKNPNRDYAGIIPDAEEVYKRYYAMKAQQKEFIKWLEDKLNMCDSFLDTIKSDLEEISYAGRVSGKTYIATQIMKNETAKKCYEEVLSKYKEIVGGNNDQ